MFIVQEIGSIVPSTKKRMRGGKNAEELGTRPTFETGVITSVHCGYNGNGNLRYLNKLLRIKYNAKMNFIPICLKIWVFVTQMVKCEWGKHIASVVVNQDDRISEGGRCINLGPRCTVLQGRALHHALPTPDPGSHLTLLLISNSDTAPHPIPALHPPKTWNSTPCYAMYTQASPNCYAVHPERQERCPEGPRGGGH